MAAHISIDRFGHKASFVARGAGSQGYFSYFMQSQHCGDTWFSQSACGVGLTWHVFMKWRCHAFISKYISMNNDANTPDKRGIYRLHFRDSLSFGTVYCTETGKHVLFPVWATNNEKNVNNSSMKTLLVLIRAMSNTLFCSFYAFFSTDQRADTNRKVRFRLLMQGLAPTSLYLSTFSPLI